MAGRSKGPSSGQPSPLSSAAEYLTFIASSGGQPVSTEILYQDENLWLTQRMMAELYGVNVRTVNEHVQTLLRDGEIADVISTIRKFRIVQLEGTREVERDVVHYSLQAIIAVGFKIENARAVQLRKWAGQVVKDYTIQGWVMDADRLKKGHMFTDEYFERQLQLIREIRLSERKFYQKVTDLYASAFDYDPSASTTRSFFALVQNKMHWAVHRHTAAELIVDRANAEKEHMGLTTWESAPNGKIVKTDVVVAKNYLSKSELDHLGRIVTMYLDYAELQAMRKIPMTMEDWAKRLDGFLEFNEQEILTGPGRVSKEEAKLHAETQFEKFRIVQDRLFESDFDRFLILEERAQTLQEKE